MTAEIDHPKEIPIDSPDHWTVRTRFWYAPIPNSPATEVVFLQTDLKFSDVEDPGLCPCGGHQQKEWTEDYYKKVGRHEFRPEPGLIVYGCADCSLKVLTDVYDGFEERVRIVLTESSVVETPKTL